MTLLFALSSFVILSNRVQAQTPGLLWSTNIGARLFVVDAQTNVYANAGGTVIKLNSAGLPLQTNTICPVPAYFAERDSSGNFYFTGSFDGTQDFGGITLVGGWINNINFNPPQWVAGYPTCFLAKYDNGGGLLWAVAFGSQVQVNKATDLMVAPDGSVVVGYAAALGGSYLRDYSESGSNRWDQLVAPGSPFFPADASPPWQVRIAKDNSTNAYFLVQRPSQYGDSFGGRFDSDGNLNSFGFDPRWSWTGSSTNAKPAICDSAGAATAGLGFNPSAFILIKYSNSGGREWTNTLPSTDPWTLGGDSQGSLYVADTNGVLYSYDCAGTLLWSTNLGSRANCLLINQGVRLISFQNGVVARLSDTLSGQKPSIQVEPQPVAVFVGDTFQLSVSATGSPTLQYFWRLHGTNIAGATSSTFARSNATPAQAGPYTVLITNAAGSITSAPALVRVKSVALYLGDQLLTNGTYHFASPPTLTIRSAFSNGSSFYTLDGSTPGFESTSYSGPFVLSKSATVRAVGYSADFSQVEEADTVKAVLLGQHNLSVTTSGGGIITPNTNPSPADANCVTRPSGAVAWWRAENNFTDAVGGHSAVVYGNTTYSNGIVGQAFHFDGELSRAQVRVADAADLRFTTAMTLEAWVKPEGGATVVSKWSANGFQPKSSFRLNIGNSGQDLKAYFQVSPDGSGGGTSAVYPPYCRSDSDLPLGTWTHLACTYDGSILRVYVNGILDGQSPYSSGIFPGNYDLGIGGIVGGSLPGSGFDHYAGMVDDN